MGVGRGRDEEGRERRERVLTGFRFHEGKGDMILMDSGFMKEYYLSGLWLLQEYNFEGFGVVVRI